MINKPNKSEAGETPSRGDGADAVIEELLPELRAAIEEIDGKSRSPGHRCCAELIRKKMRKGGGAAPMEGR